MADLFKDPFDPMRGFKIFERLSGAEAARAEGKSAENIARYNAAVKEQEAKAIKQRAIFAQRRLAKKGAEAESTLIAKLGAAGGLGSPVAADLAAEQAAEFELEELLIGYEGEVGATRALTQAQLDRLSGKFARERAKNLATQRNVEFGASLLTGFA